MFMAGENEQKILDAALKVFSEKGYKGATIREISEKAGFSELTLFRKFETKKNLYEMVIFQNTGKLKKEFLSLLSEEEFESPKEYLKTILQNITNAMENNIEFLQLVLSRESAVYITFTKKFHFNLAKHLEKNIKNSKINYMTLALDITSFLYMGVINNKIVKSNFDAEMIMNGYIDNCILLIQS